MTIETFQMLSIASFVLAGVFFIVAVILFFVFDVPKLYGDVSGRAAKKAIREIRERNESSGNKAYKPSPVNAGRGKLTDRISASGRLVSQTQTLPIGPGTEKFSTAALMPQSNETTVLQSDNQTTVLDMNANTMQETTVLQYDMMQNNDAETHQKAADYTANPFRLDVEIGFAENTEIIE